MNRLEHLADFQKILAEYRVSPASKRILKLTPIALLVAPTSTGRNTIIRELVKTGEYHFIISDTTRQPREQDGVPERSGVDYWFRSEKEMLADLRNGKFLEAAVIHNQQVSGISIREMAAARDEGKIAITDIEIVGVHNILQVKSDAVAIFVLPPSFNEWQKRIKKRGKMHGDEFRRRLESAAWEYAAALEHEYYHFVVNDTVASAAEQIHERVKLGLVDKIAQTHARDLAERLYLETQAFLKALPK
jgi:guanylate kinase